MQRSLKSFAAVFILGGVTACEPSAPDREKPVAPEPEKILLYCDGESSEPVKMTGEDGSEFKGIISYRGFYRIDLKAETLEAQLGRNDEFISQCSSGGPCKLVSNKSEIRFEDYGRSWEDKVIDVTYVFERNTGYFSRKTEIKKPNGTETEYATGSCRPINSIDQQLF